MAVCTQNYGARAPGAALTVGDADPTAIDAVNVGAGASLTYESALGVGCPTVQCAKHTAVAGMNSYWQWTTQFGTQTDFYGRIYLYVGALPLANSVHIAFGRNSGANAWLMMMDTTGHIRLMNSAQAIILTSTSHLTAGQWARIEWHVVNNVTTGSLRCRIFLTPTSNTPDEDLNFGEGGAAAQNTGAQTNQMSVGDGNQGATTIYTAGVQIGAVSWIGPMASGSPSVTTLKIAVG